MGVEGSFVHGEITHQILGCAYEVHRTLGPGLMESAYKASLVHEFSLRGLAYAAETPIPIRYKGVQLDAGYRADLIVEDRVIVELKAMDRLLPIHDAQLMTYLRLSQLQVGLLINFNVSSLKAGIRRIALRAARGEELAPPK